MATLGNYVSALGGMAKEAITGTAKGLVGGLKGAMIREAPGIAGVYEFGKDLNKRANSYAKMPAGGTPPSAGTSNTSSPLGGFAQAVSAVAGINQGNVINLEQVRQLKQLNDNVVNQSKLIAFQIADQKRKDQFAEETANEQAVRDDALLQAIKQIGSRDSSGKKSSDDGRGGSSSFLGKIGDLISDNLGSIIGSIIGGYFGAKTGVPGRVLGGIGRGAAGQAAGSMAGRAVPQIGMAGRAVPQIGMAGRAAASNIIDVEARVISSSAARGALAEGIGTIVPMVLRFLTGPVGLGIMAAAGIGTYLYSKRDPDKAAAASANSALKKLKNQPPETEGQFRKVKITQDEAKVLLEQRAEREKEAVEAEAKAKTISESTTATAEQKETAKKFAEGRREAVDYDIKPYGGLDRIQKVAAGLPDPGGAVSTSQYLDKMKGVESGGKNIANPIGGTAGGVYQITDSTWTGNVTKMIAAGDKRFTKADLDPKMKFNPEKARAVAEFITNQNISGLKNGLRKDPTETDVYMAWFLGLGDNNSGAIQFLKAKEKDPAQLAWKLASSNEDSDIINNNAEIFYQKVSRDPTTKKVLSKEGPRSVQALYDLMKSKVARFGGTGDAVVIASTGSTSGNTTSANNEGNTKEKRPGTKVEVNNKEVKDFYAKDDSPFRTAGGGLLFPPEASVPGNPPPSVPRNPPPSVPGNPPPSVPEKKSTWMGQTDEWGNLATPVATPTTRSLSGGTKIAVKNAPIKTEDDKLRKVTENIAKQQGIDPKKSSATQTPTQKQKETARLASIVKPLYKSNTDIINDTNQKFLQGFKSTATRAFTQILTKEFFPKGLGVSYDQAKRDDNYRGQQLQKIFGTQAASQKFATGLLGKTYGPMFAPLFNQMAQGYLEVGSRIAGNAIFQGIGKLGAEEAQGIMGQVLGNYAAGNKKLALEQLIFGASGGRNNGGIALGMESLFAKYGFNNPTQGISYFAGGLADMATAPLANMLGGDTTNGVRFDNRTGKYYNRDGTESNANEYAAAARQYGASINQGPLFSVGNDNYSGRGQPGTTQMQGGVVQQGYGQQYGSSPAPGQFRVVAPTVNTITGVTTAPTLAQALGLTQQTVAGFSKEQLAVAEAQLDLARIEGTKRAEEAKAKLISDAESRAQSLGLEKDSAEYNRMVAAASDRGNAIVTMEAAKYTVSGLSGQGKEGGGTAIQGTLKPGDPGYREGQLFQNPTGGGKLSFGQELGNFGFDVGKMMLGNKISQSLGIKNPYAQMFANFAIQKGLNYGFEALKGTDLFKGMFGGPSSPASTWMGQTDEWGSLADAAGDVTDVVDAGSDIADVFSWFAADGGIATKTTPGVFGEAGAEAIIPLSNPTATKALSSAMGTDKQLSALGDQTQLLSSIDNSLLTISGKSAGSGTNIGGGSLSSSGSSYMMSGGLGGVWNPTATTSSGLKPGVNAGKPGAPSTMDIVGSIATSLVKSYVVKTAIGAALNLAVPGTTAALAAGFEGGIMAGVSNAVGMVPQFLSAAGTNISSALGLGEGVGVLASGASSVASALGATEVAAAFASEGLMAGLAAMGPVGWAGLAVVGVAAALGYGGGGGGGSAPPPKEPKFHAAIYVTGNNNIDAIAPVYETVDYHAVPDVYKTIAYGLLRVAFNAAKAAESVTKMAPPFDYLYIKVEYNRISLCWGKGAPNANTLATSDANQVGSWGPPSKEQNLNAVASDIVDLINKEFKKTANAQQLTKLDTAAKALGNMTLDQLSSGLIQDLKTGEFKLDKSVEKGIYANNVAESNRIGSLINASSTHAGYVSTGTSAEYDADGNLIKEGTTGGTPMIWSMKDNAYVDATRSPGALLLDAQGRPVYDIPGTSAGLTAEDFGGTDVVGIDRPANLYSPTTGSVTSGSGSGGTVISAPSNTKIDNSAVNNFYNTPSNSLDMLRNTGPK